ncbi:rRNA processing protein [Malassezia caprae]|uniref:Pre-rRNA-processing protein n=1 Tax=Malassezia caprae TaxID=1381934 RepID=A0AAF0EA32_9BASI|nr:rRNA processing protein [Malassezia caprae]
MGTKRKATPATDFTKTKKKLGKGKQVASNATDTSFKAKSIAMPQQSIMLDRTQSVTTRRRQTLADLVQNTRHHSPGVRKDAVLGMLELITTYEGLVQAEATTLLNSVLPLLSDIDVHVRAAVTRYLRTLLEQMSMEMFVPYTAPMLLLVTSAMSHITMAVRLDALSVLALLLDKVGHMATDGWESGLDTSASADRHGQRILMAFFAMLGVAADAQRAKAGITTKKSTASIDLRSADRLRVLRTLRHFLRVAADDMATPSMPMWCFHATFPSPGHLEHFLQLFAKAPPTGPLSWVEQSIPSVTTENLCEALLAGARTERNPSSHALVSAYERLAHILHASLLATLLDSLPSVVAPDGTISPVHADLVTAILDVYLVLWRRVVAAYMSVSASQRQSSPDAVCAQQDQLLGHLAPYFPTAATGSSASALVRLNGVYCEMVALATVLSQKRSSTPKSKAQMYMEPALAYLVSLLNSQDGLSDELYEMLLPTFWLFVTTPNEGSADLLSALLAHFQRLRTSPFKAQAFRVLARLSLLHTYGPEPASLAAIQHARVHSAWQAWLLTLPRMLWEASTQAVSTRATPEAAAEALEVVTHMIEFIRLVTLQADGVVFEHATLRQLGPQMQPLFSVRHPKRGMVPGPVHKLPIHVQHMAHALANGNEGILVE